MTSNAGAKRILDAAGALDEAVTPGPKPASNALPDPGPAKPGQPNPVRMLSRHLATACNLVHDNGRAYAVPRDYPGSLMEEYPAGIAIPFGAELRRLVVRIANRGGLPPISKGTADMVLLQLEAAAFESGAVRLALRFHDGGDRVVLDLGRKDGQMVIITAAGWETGPGPKSVPFRRSHAIRPLPPPERGGTLDELAPVLALDPDSETFRALLGYGAGLAFESSGRAGILLTGPPGSAKSTRLRLVISVVEPTAATDFGKHFGAKPDDDEVRALHRAVPVWDNVSAMSQTGSDHLCVLITGTAREGRLLYTNDDISTAAVARPAGLTAVATPAGLRPDALDRLIVLDTGPPAAKLDDDQVQQWFDQAHPRLLGAWCDAISAILRWRPSTAIPAGDWRPPAHARRLAALDAAVAAGDLKGCPADLFGAYAAARLRVKQQTAADDTFGGALIAMLEQMPVTRAELAGRLGQTPVIPAGVRQWQGKAAELLSDFRLRAPLRARDVPGWPTSPRGLPVVLNQLKAPLEACGVTWTVEQDDHTKSNRYIFTLRDD